MAALNYGQSFNNLKKSLILLTVFFIISFAFFSFTENALAADSRCINPGTGAILVGKTVETKPVSGQYCNANRNVSLPSGLPYTSPQYKKGPEQCGFCANCCSTSSWGCERVDTFYRADQKIQCDRNGNAVYMGNWSCREDTRRIAQCDTTKRGCYKPLVGGTMDLCPEDRNVYQARRGVTCLRDYYQCDVRWDIPNPPVGYCIFNDICPSDSPGGGDDDPDFNLSVSPRTWIDTKEEGINYALYTVTLTAEGGFSGNVRLSLNNCPSRASCSFQGGNNVFVSGSPDSKTLRVRNLDSVSTGNYSLVFRGSGGGESDSDTATLQIKEEEDDDEETVIPPRNLSESCPAPHTQATVSWEASGYDRYHVRMNPGANKYCWPLDSCSSGGIATSVTGTTTWSFSTTPGQSYTWWLTVIHPKTLAQSDYVDHNLSCQDEASYSYSITPPSVSFTAEQNGSTPSPRTITVRNTGNRNLDISVSENVNGLRVNRTFINDLSPDSSTNVIVSAISTDYPVGPRTGNIFFNNSQGAGSQRIPATYVITAPDREEYSLEVIRTGLGTVESAPSGISCGAVCRESYEEDTSVTLTANPEPGRIFAGWGGACAGTPRTSNCSLVIDAPKTVLVNFVIDPDFSEF